MLLRNLLWARLQDGCAEEFASEALGIDLLGLCLRSMHAGCNLRSRRTALARNRRAVATATKPQSSTMNRSRKS
jgi:hypothetical protein